MKVVFRTDASLDIGIGHVMRCLTLAEAMRTQGENCHFICREHPGHLLDNIRNRGFAVSALHKCKPDAHPLDETGEPLAHANWLGCDWGADARQTGEILSTLKPDWLVVDHYALDSRWESALRAHYGRLLVIDDLADRPHACDLLLDQNLGRAAADYVNLVPEHCTVLAGPRFALLRPEFAALREYSLQRRRLAALSHLLITMGGVDQQNATGQVLEALKSCPLPADCKVTVVMGSKAPWLAQVREIAATMPWPTEVRVDIADMAQVMADSDLAIGAAGSTSWERCCLGVPTLLVPIAENQKSGALALSASGAVISFQGMREVESRLVEELTLLESGQRLKLMVDAAASICDGRGCDRMVSVLRYLSGERLMLRRADKSDAKLLYQWANDPVTRGNAFNTEPIDWRTHQSWFRNKLENTEGCLIIIASLSTAMPCGQVRFERDEDGSWVIDYSLAPEFRGMRLGRPLLANALRFLAEVVANATVVGKVKAGNTPSRRIFESLGFFADARGKNDLIVFRRAL